MTDIIEVKRLRQQHADAIETVKHLQTEIERLTAARELMQLDAEKYRAERDLWKERTEQGSLIIEGNVAEIERLQEQVRSESAYQSARNVELRGNVERLTALVQELEAELRKSAYSEGELQAEIKQLRALRVEWP